MNKNFEIIECDAFQLCSVFGFHWNVSYLIPEICIVIVESEHIP